MTHDSAAPMHDDLEVRASVAARGFSTELRVAAGETIAVLGPNGAGKSTLLSVISGLLRPDDGHVRLAGQTLFESSRESSVFLPPHARGVSLLAQEPLLFPHLSVLDNVAFGPRSSGKSTRESRAIARSWLAEVDASELADRRPASLSGGQAQRIAVARALASDPQLLLLDEPFAALDVAVAPALRRMLRRVLQGRTVVIVTHDVLDAFTLADRVVVMHEGTIVDEGPTRRVLERPRTRFTAELAALNLLTGVRTEGGMRVAGGVEVVATEVAAFAAGGAAALAVRPSAVSVSVSEPTRAGLNVLRATVHDLEPRGDVVRVRGQLDGSDEHAGDVNSGDVNAEDVNSADVFAADVLPRVVVDLDLVPGSDIYFAFEPDAATLYQG